MMEPLIRLGVQMRGATVGSIAAAGMLALCALSGCGSADTPEVVEPTKITFAAGSTMARLHDAQRVTIGSKFDQPGFGLKGLDGKPAGFDVEIAKIIAGELGIPVDKIAWRETPAKVREDYLVQGKVDLITATYTINDRRKQRVDFAGPYYVAGQQLMIRKNDTSITGPDSFMDGTKKVCSGTGTIPADTIKSYLRDVARQLVLYDIYADCAKALLAKQVDAVTTDNVILTGFVAEHPDDLTLVGARFTSELYGIGVRKGDDSFRAFINDLLERIAKDGRYAKAWTDTAGKFDPSMPEAPGVDRY
jgi:glutamate transport system substrate-binding protein